MNETSNTNPALPIRLLINFSFPQDEHSYNFLLVMIVINAVMAAVASCSNAVVIYTISRTPSLRTPSNILILGLAISDLSVGVFAQPCSCVLLFAEAKRNFSLYYWAGKIQLASTWTLASVSFSTLTAVTADRFLAVYLHLRYQEQVSSKRYISLLGMIWFVCLFLGVYNGLRTGLPIRILIGILFFMLSTMNGYFIFTVYRTIRRHSAQIHATSLGQNMNMPKYKKYVQTMYVVIGAFVVCYAPFIGAWLVLVITNFYNQWMHFVLIICQTLVMMNGVLNPIIYCWRIEEIRNAARTLLRHGRRPR